MSKNIFVGILSSFLLSFGIVACSDKSSAVESKLISVETISSPDEDYVCSVETYDNQVVQVVYAKDSARVSSGANFNGNGYVTGFFEGTFENLSQKELEKLCAGLASNAGIEDLNSVVCKDGKISYKVSISERDAYPLAVIADNMKQECKELRDDWVYDHKDISSFLTSSTTSSSYSSSSMNEVVDPAVQSSSSVVRNDSGYVSTTHVAYLLDATSAMKMNLKYDAYTLYFEDFSFNVVIPGYVSLSDKDSIMLGWDLDQNIQQGSFEFFFRPHLNFKTKSTQMLAGNDGARLLVYYEDDKLVFMMNRTNEFGYVKAAAEIVDDWNFVQGEWDGDKIYLYLNGSLIGTETIGHGYEASNRNWENQIVLGYKSSCCRPESSMIASAMYTDADFGPIRISNIMRSKQ